MPGDRVCLKLVALALDHHHRSSSDILVFGFTQLADIHRCSRFLGDVLATFLGCNLGIRVAT